MLSLIMNVNEHVFAQLQFNSVYFSLSKTPQQSIISFHVVITGNSYTEPVLLYNGTAMTLLDNNSLTPYTSYEYRVTVYNSAGSETSQWVRVRTYQGLPQGLIPPALVVSEQSMYSY